MAEKGYQIRYRLDGGNSYLLWIPIETDANPGYDRLATDDSGRIVRFENPEQMSTEVEKQGLDLSPEPASFYDLDFIEQWVKCPRRSGVDCVEFLNAWNLFSDVLSTVRGEYALIDGHRHRYIYDKLFLANMPPMLLKGGRPYIPRWNAVELEVLRMTLRNGLRLFREAVQTEHLPVNARP